MIWHKAKIWQNTEAWRNALQISIEEGGKVLEISGQLREQQREGKTTVDWRRVNWWEHGFVRRLELPEDADSSRMEARIKNDLVLEIKIPKLETNQSSESKSKDNSDEDAWVVCDQISNGKCV